MLWRMRMCTWMLVIIAALPLPFANGEEPEGRVARQISLPFPLPTLGGKQFWTDELVYAGWRIQRNAWSGGYRLLDANDVLRSAGDFAACLAAFERIKEQTPLTAPGKEVVIVLHGLARTRAVMEPLSNFLEEEGGYTVANVSYASTRDELDQHAASLACVIERLGPEVESIHFVGHSMGNLVVRRYLHGSDEGPEQWEPDPRVRRIVMLAPPNQGAQMAQRLKNNVLFYLIAGDNGDALSRRWEAMSEQLATPKTEFGIIAGALADEVGGNPLIAGSDDFILAVDETRLAGAADFVVIPSIHTTLMNHPLAREYTLRFLRQGHFISEDARQPLEITEDARDTAAQ